MEELQYEKITMKDILKVLISKRVNDECCLKSLSFDKTNQKIMIFRFSKPTDINISSSEQVWGSSLKYLSHIQEHQD